MRLGDLTGRLLKLSEVLHAWLELLTGLEAGRRRRIAAYADQIAATLSRTAGALAQLQADRSDRHAARICKRDLGRISGYVEDIVALLEDRLDGRKIAGVKRRLATIAAFAVTPAVAEEAADRLIDKLLEAEGYFRALADGLRV